MKTLMFSLLLLSTFSEAKEIHRVIRFREAKQIVHIRDEVKVDQEVSNKQEMKKELIQRMLARSRK